MMEKSEKLDKEEAERLDWIDTFEKLDSYDKEDQGLRRKFKDKIKENPIVPIGMLATTLALTVGIWSMRKGDKRRSQLMMRARIGAQGFTIAAIIIGVFIASSKKKPADGT